jgi:hypothetical protein
MITSLFQRSVQLWISTCYTVLRNTSFAYYVTLYWKLCVHNQEIRQLSHCSHPPYSRHFLNTGSPTYLETDNGWVLRCDNLIWQQSECFCWEMLTWRVPRLVVHSVDGEGCKLYGFSSVALPRNRLETKRKPVRENSFGWTSRRGSVRNTR